MRIEPMTVTIGGEVSDVDLTGGWSDTLADSIYEALIDRGVLVFRNQSLPPDAHMRLAESLGPLGAPHPLYPTVPGYPQIARILNDDNHPPESEVWHSDLSCRPDPPFAAVLRAATLPPVGGDTLWADMRAVCAALPAELRERVRGRAATHTMEHGFRFLADYGQTERQDQLAATDRSAKESSWPIIMRHPATGHEVLYVNECFTERVDGFSDNDSATVLGELCNWVRHPRFQVRLRWAPGTVVIWDNWATQHFATGDHYPMHQREVQRVTVAGDHRAPSLRVSAERAMAGASTG